MSIVSRIKGKVRPSAPGGEQGRNLGHELLCWNEIRSATPTAESTLNDHDWSHETVVGTVVLDFAPKTCARNPQQRCRPDGVAGTSQQVHFVHFVFSTENNSPIPCFDEGYGIGWDTHVLYHDRNIEIQVAAFSGVFICCKRTFWTCFWGKAARILLFPKPFVKTLSYNVNSKNLYIFYNKTIYLSIQSKSILDRNKRLS